MGAIVRWSPSTAIVGSNLVYTVYALNPGTNVSTSVTISNFLPDNVLFLSANASQGSATQTNGVVTANLGTIGSLSSATVTITVVPAVAGAYLTNRAILTRTEPDSNLNKNTVTTVLCRELARKPLDIGCSGWRWPDVRGPGNLTFWWKVSSESSHDLLKFLANSVALTNISGLVDWQKQSWLIPAGFFTLRWSYEKDGSGSAGSDARWLDQISYSIPQFYMTNMIMFTNGNLQFTLEGTNGQRPFLDQSADLNLWTAYQTVTLGSSNYIFITSTNAFAQSNRFFRAYHLNTP